MWWSVLVETKAPEVEEGAVPVDVDQVIGDLVEVLIERGAAGGGDARGWDVRLSIETADEVWAASAAAGAGLQMVLEAADKVGLPLWPIVRLEADAEAELDRQLAEPNFPAVAGTSEVTELLGVSRQRLHELRTSGRFPEPMVELAAGPIWLRSTIESFLEQWERKPGRPAKSVHEILADADKLDEDLGRFGNGQMGGPFPPSGS